MTPALAACRRKQVKNVAVYTWCERTASKVPENRQKHIDKEQWIFRRNYWNSRFKNLLFCLYSGKKSKFLPLLHCVHPRGKRECLKMRSCYKAPVQACICIVNAESRLLCPAIADQHLYNLLLTNEFKLKKPHQL